MQKKPQARGGATLSKTNDTYTIIGGARRDQTHFSDLWQVQIKQTSNGPIPGYKFFKTPSNFLPRSGHTASTSKKLLYIFGGGNAALNRYNNEFWRFDALNQKFELLETKNTPEVRGSHAACTFESQNQLYIFGGANTSGPLNDLHKLDIETLTWTKIDLPEGVEPREMHSMHLIQDKYLLITGGRNRDRSLNYISRFDLEKNFWEEIFFTLDRTLCSHVGFCRKDMFYLAGGMDNFGFSNAFLKINFEKKSIEIKELSKFEGLVKEFSPMQIGTIGASCCYDEGEDRLVLFGGSKYENETDRFLILEGKQIDEEFGIKEDN